MVAVCWIVLRHYSDYFPVVPQQLSTTQVNLTACHPQALTCLLSWEFIEKLLGPWVILDAKKTTANQKQNHSGHEAYTLYEKQKKNHQQVSLL